MKSRPSWTAKQRAEIFRDAQGKCHLCDRKIAEGEPWHVEHPKARGLGGSDKQEDMRPAHVDCHAGKTKKDREIMSDADATMKKHFGTRENQNTNGQKGSLEHDPPSPPLTVAMARALQD